MLASALCAGGNGHVQLLVLQQLRGEGGRGHSGQRPFGCHAGARPLSSAVQFKDLVPSRRCTINEVLIDLMRSSTSKGSIGIITSSKGLTSFIRSSTSLCCCCTCLKISICTPYQKRVEVQLSLQCMSHKCCRLHQLFPLSAFSVA